MLLWRSRAASTALVGPILWPCPEPCLPQWLPPLLQACSSVDSIGRSHPLA